MTQQTIEVINLEGEISPVTAIPKSPSYWYLASPYSKHPLGIDGAFNEVCLAAGLLVKAGVSVFSPIAHTHPIALAAGIDPLSHDIWLAADRAFMDAASGILVLAVPGWRESFGVGHEREVFRAAGKPEIFVGFKA